MIKIIIFCIRKNNNSFLQSVKQNTQRRVKTLKGYFAYVNNYITL
jgi:hypothetical protein